MKTKLRPLRDGDIPALVKISQAKSEAIGSDPLWLPVLKDPRTDKVFVIEESGEVLGAVIFRRVWEIILTCNEPKGARAAVKANAKIRKILAQNEIDSVVAWVPSQLTEGKRKRGMDKIMERAGFRRIKNMVSYETEVVDGSE